MSETRWTIEKANAWYQQKPWLVGCNFIPSTAINQLEMWQEATFDPETIDRELSWAGAVGFNSMRVFLHDLLWQVGADRLKTRIERYLKIAAKHGIQTVFVLFDDCWNARPKPGNQPEPTPGVHNSGWVQSPGEAAVADPSQWSRLESYVKGLLGFFASDERILMWDLYNEPGNSGLGSRSLNLLQAVFTWARQVGPQQPLTAPIWFDNKPLNEFQLNASDVITFHHYSDASSLREQISHFKSFGRPVICSEYMARTRGSRFETHLPIFNHEHVGCYNWGFVSGRTQTIYPWLSPKGAPEPKEWFHDVFHPDGTPYLQSEIDLIKYLTANDKR
jgi:endo-1,4-beta-mannosidase